MRRVLRSERGFLERYFAGSLAIDRIVIGSSLSGRRSWSPFLGRISLTRDLFQEHDSRAQVRLEDPVAASVFAHEALHVWQRQHGRRVTREGAWLQAGYMLGWFDPYAYNLRLTDPRSLLAAFVLGNIEQQGRMVQDYVAADLRGQDTSRFTAIGTWIRNARPSR